MYTSAMPRTDGDGEGEGVCTERTALTHIHTTMSDGDPRMCGESARADTLCFDCGETARVGDATPTVVCMCTRVWCGVVWCGVV